MTAQIIVPCAIAGFAFGMLWTALMLNLARRGKS